MTRDAIAVELYLDPIAAASVHALWEDLSAAGLAASLAGQGSRPHITLAVYDVAEPGLSTLLADPAQLEPRLAAFAATLRPLSINLASLGAFPGPEGVVFLAPKVTRALLTAHARYHLRSADLVPVCWSYYRPRRWVPHCTLAMGLAPAAVGAAVWLQAAGAQASPLKRRLVAWAKKQGLAGGYAEQGGGKTPLLYGLARRLVFDKVRERLGLDRARLCAVSAAPIGVPTLEFFLALGIPVFEVYGMSECTGPTTSSLPGAYRTGSAGRALPGTELKVAADGEILMRGPHVCLGYFKDPEATRETIDADGWLHSGDVGELVVLG